MSSLSQFFRPNLSRSFPWAFVGLIAVAALLVSSVSVVTAQSLDEGFTLTQDNLDAHLQDTFEDNTIESMLTPTMKRRIKRDGQKMRLCHSKQLPQPEEWKTATRNHHDESYLEMEQTTNFGKRPIIKNFSAGLPFPDVKEGDNLAGYKAMYNGVFGRAVPHYFEWREWWGVFVDKENGFERLTRNTSQIYQYYNQWQGKTDSHNHVEGDGTVFRDNVVFILGPQNLKGIGQYTAVYADGRLQDGWAYVRSLRRVRRTASDNWFSRSAVTGDSFFDVFFPKFSMPFYYPDLKYLGTKTILSSWIRNMKDPAYPVVGTTQAGVKWVDLENSPYWNYDSQYTCYTPMKTHVIKEIMPEEHQLKYRITYYNARNWLNVLSEEYDKRGELWQRHANTFQNYKTANEFCSEATFNRNQGTINWKAGHATPLAIKQTFLNTIGVEKGDISLRTLRRAEPYRPGTIDQVREVCPEAVERGLAE